MTAPAKENDQAEQKDWEIKDERYLKKVESYFSSN